jgi:caspase domain-containing protein
MAESARARKRALLIGVTRYRWAAAYQAPFDLHGPANDVAALRAVLETAFGFAAADIATLLSEPGTPADRLATGPNIRLALQLLIDATQPDDTVLVYYSGHGSQWPDLNGDEPDRYDEAIVPCDARDPAAPAPPQGDLIDDELHNYVARLSAKTANLTIIFDCCHAATGTRADPLTGLTPRQVEYNRPLAGGAVAPAAAIAEAAAAAPAAPRHVARSAIGDSPRYVFLAACRADEVAYEFRVAPDDAVWAEEQALVGQAQGLFTYFLLRALRHGPTATYDDILTFLRDQAGTQEATQHPQGEGPLDRQVFGGSTRPVDWLPVAGIAGNTVTLAAGSERGLAPGAVIQVYPGPAAVAGVALGQEAPLGTATVTRVFPLRAEAIFAATPSHPPAHARALVIRPVYPGRQLRVAVLPAEGAAPGAVQALTAAIAGQPLLQLVAPTDPAPDAVAAIDAAGIDFTITAPAPDGHPLPGLAPLGGPGTVVPVDTLAEPAASRMAALSAFRDGLARANPASGLNGLLTMRLVPVGGGPAPAGEPVLRPGASYNIVFTYQNPAPPTTAPGPLYFVLFRFAADGSVTQLYPPPGSQETLAPGQQWPPLGGEDYFRLEVPPMPPGPGPARDWLKLFVATAEIDLRGLQQPPIPTTPTRTAEPLPPRGAAVPALRTDAGRDWTSLLVSYRVAL